MVRAQITSQFVCKILNTFVFFKLSMKQILFLLLTNTTFIIN